MEVLLFLRSCELYERRENRREQGYSNRETGGNHKEAGDEEKEERYLS